MHYSYHSHYYYKMPSEPPRKTVTRILNNPETCTMQRKERRHALKKNVGERRLMVGMPFTKTIPRANTREGS